MATILAIAIVLTACLPSRQRADGPGQPVKTALFQVLEKDFLQPKLASARQINALNRAAAGAFAFAGYDEFKSAAHLPSGPGIAGITRYAGQIFRLLDFEFVLRERATEGRRVFLSERFWEEEFARDAGVIGMELILNGVSYRVAGVLRNRSRLLEKTDIWMPANPHDLLSESACLRVLASAAGRAAWRGVAKVLDETEEGAELTSGARFLSIEREMVVGGPEIAPSMIATSAELAGGVPAS